MDLWSDFAACRDYHPHCHGENPAFTETDALLLDFKNDGQAGFQNVLWTLGRYLDGLSQKKPAILAMIPGHEAAKSNGHQPMARLIHRLAQDRPRRYIGCPDLLTRRDTIPKLATGGLRSAARIQATMSAKAQIGLAGSLAIVLDDVATTGISIRAARRRLFEAGAQRVGGLAVGRARA